MNRRIRNRKNYAAYRNEMIEAFGNTLPSYPKDEIDSILTDCNDIYGAYFVRYEVDGDIAVLYEDNGSSMEFRLV